LALKGLMAYFGCPVLIRRNFQEGAKNASYEAGNRVNCEAVYLKRIYGKTSNGVNQCYCENMNYGLHAAPWKPVYLRLLLICSYRPRLWRRFLSLQHSRRNTSSASYRFSIFFFHFLQILFLTTC